MECSHDTSEARNGLRLILLCWLVYACSYIGKLGYNANISQIGAAYGVSYAEAGMVSTFFFFAYGGGQVINGLLCKRYPIKWVVLSCLSISAVINISVALGSDFGLLKYLWLINGAAMSFLWTILIRLLSETLSQKDIPRAIYWMGTTVATGTFLVYGMSALFVAVASWRVTFYVAAAILFLAALIWLLRYDRLVKPLKREREAEAPLLSQSDSARGKGFAAIGGMIAVLAFFAVVNNFVKDGITAWTPDILARIYNTPGWLSILLTLLLPAMAIGGVAVASRAYARTGSFVGVCAILFGATTVLIGVVLALLQTGLPAVTVGCLAIVSCMMAGVNNVITSMVPLHMKEKVHSGSLAGVLNGFCYLGSTVSMYLLGAIADAWGWRAVFVVLLMLSGAALLLGLGYLALRRGKAHQA
ncbi:MAG: MFS transporter [Ruminococcaceae bacterium]|nr:MFS transporter [Oscillospiraceae bacterium]